MNEKENNTYRSNTLINYKSSDIIANEIINKLISLTISTSFNDKIKQQVTSKCFSYLKDTIENYLSCQYIFCDRDENNYTTNNIINNNNKNISSKKNIRIDYSSIDNDINKSNIKKSPDISNINHEISDDKIFNYDIYYSNVFHGINDWNLIKEPVSNIADRCQSTMINIQEVDKLKYELNYKIIEEDEIFNTQEKDSILTKNINIKNDDNNNGNNGNASKTNSSKKKTKIKKENKKEDVKETKEQARQRILEIMNENSYYDLSPRESQKFLNRESNLATLRQEYEEHSLKIRQELFELNKTRLEALSKKRIEEEKNKKYIGKRITKDHSGQIIIIKPLKLEKLKEEFTSLKSKTSFIELIKGIFTPQKKLKKIKIQKNPLNGDFFQLFKTTKNTKSNNSENNSRNKYKNKLSKSEDKNHKTNKKVETSMKRLPPSGSSFYLMNMSVGVSIKEDNKFKTGGFDFFNKYKKYSIENYNKQLKEAINLNKLLDTHIRPKKKLPTKKFERSLSNFQDINTNLDNKKITSTLTSLNNTNNKNNLMQQNNYTSIKSENTSTLYNKYIKNIGHKISLSPEIKLSFGSSLIDTINTLNLKNDDVKYLNKNKIKNIKQNIFRKTGHIASMKNMLLNEINEFNKELLTKKNFDFKPNIQKNIYMEKSNKSNNYGLPPRNRVKIGDDMFDLKTNERRKLFRNRSRFLLPLKINSLYTGNEYQ